MARLISMSFGGDNTTLTDSFFGPNLLRFASILAIGQLTFLVSFVSISQIVQQFMNGTGSQTPARQLLPPSGTVTTTSPTTNQSSNTNGMLYDAWIYPDAPGAMTALQQDGSELNAVKVEFLHVNEDGTISEIDQTPSTPNGYSAANVALIKQNSKEQFITVSGDDTASTLLAMQNSAASIQTMVNLANKTGFGIELDWEDFGSWTPSYYSTFKTFVSQLATALHQNGHQLILDGPPIYNATSQAWYQWKYEQLAPLVDGVVMMVYDNEYDTGAGNSISPAQWTQSCIQWLKQTAGSKGIVGLAAYGYKADLSSGSIAVEPSTIIQNEIPSSATITRNADGELTATVNGEFYDYSDQQTMQTRLNEVEQAGMNQVSVWSLGDNPWFSDMSGQ
jgi:spore germination protein YaaH